MKMNNQYQRIVPFIIFALALVLLFVLVRPMITILLSAILLAFVSYPLHKRIMKRLPYHSLSVFLSLLLVVIIVLVPFLLLAFEVTQQGYYFYTSLSTSIEKGAIFGLGCTSADSKVCALLNRAEVFSMERLSTFGFDKQLQKLLLVLEQIITKFVLSIPIIIAEIFLTLVIAYFIMKEWKVMVRKIVALLPMRKTTIGRFIKEFRNITQTVIYAQLFVAFVQGVAGTIGFYLLGVPFPIILGLLMAFCALIPTIGTAIIWFPASVFLMASGFFSHDYWILAKGIALLLYGLLVISTIDNVLLARLVHTKTKVSQVIVIIGVIGGATLFGVAGIFIGPILLPLLITYFETFKERFE